MKELDKIVYKSDQKNDRINEKQKKKSPVKNNNDESWIDMTDRQDTDLDLNNKYEKYINALGKMCSDKDTESKFLVDI